MSRTLTISGRALPVSPGPATRSTTRSRANGADYLDGGIGADILYGYNGDDTFYVDNIGDAVVENANQGTDWVVCYLSSYTLGANVENLNYLGPSTTGFTGTGNSLNNTILGWNGADRLDGGIGADTMRGYDGDDLFYVDNIGDAALENANEGTDTIVTTLTSYTLAANIETLTSTAAAASPEPATASTTRSPSLPSTTSSSERAAMTRCWVVSARTT